MKIKTSELSGAELDWAVAVATEAWTFAHANFPTMTLDPTFSAVELRQYPRGDYGSCMLTCVLIPRNSMRQDPQAFCPSTDWSHGGPLIARFKVDIITERDCLVAAYANDDKYQPLTEDMYGSDHLIAACRAIVAAKLGYEVETPEGL